MSDQCITKKVFNWDKQKDHNNWASDIENIFNNLDLQTLYEQNELCDLNTLDEKLKKYDETKWQKAVEAKPKLRLY